MLQLFCEDNRAEIKAANPEAGFGEIGKLLAAAWKDCDADSKSQYQQQSQVKRLVQCCMMSCHLVLHVLMTGWYWTVMVETPKQEGLQVRGSMMMQCH